MLFHRSYCQGCSSISLFRIAVLLQASWLPVDAEIVAALDDVATQLDRLGARVVETQPEGFDLVPILWAPPPS
jgi:Asp-tRNA(Asn)/Glu-tRNA(Gln) amidotransferase A subunit family amidase